MTRHRAAPPRHPVPGSNVYYDNGLATVPEPLDPEQFNGDNLANAIEADVRAGTLARVSWVVTNQQYSEHPDGAPTDGAYYIGKVLKALHADPDVFNSTLVIIDFDENDGQFDHVPPAVPSPGPPTSSTWSLRSPLRRSRSASDSGCRCCSSRRGPAAAGSPPRSATTPR